MNSSRHLGLQHSNLRSNLTQTSLVRVGLETVGDLALQLDPDPPYRRRRTNSVQIGLPTIEPGSLWENESRESFNARSRDEFLNGKSFDSLREAQILIENRRKHDNTKRPYSALGHCPPSPEINVALDPRPVMRLHSNRTTQVGQTKRVPYRNHSRYDRYRRATDPLTKYRIPYFAWLPPRSLIFAGATEGVSRMQLLRFALIATILAVYPPIARADSKEPIVFNEDELVSIDASRYRKRGLAIDQLGSPGFSELGIELLAQALEKRPNAQSCILYSTNGSGEIVLDTLDWQTISSTQEIEVCLYYLSLALKDPHSIASMLSEIGFAFQQVREPESWSGRADEYLINASWLDPAGNIELLETLQTSIDSAILSTAYNLSAQVRINTKSDAVDVRVGLIYN